MASNNNSFQATSRKQGANSVWIPGNNLVNGTERIQIVTAHKYVYSSTPVQLDPMYNPDGGPAFNQANINTPGTAENNYRNAVNGSLLNTTVRTFRTTEDLRELLQRDARYGVDYDGSGGFEADGSDVNEGVKVTVGATGEFIISNPNVQSTPPNGIVQNNRRPHDISFNVTAYTDAKGKVSTNTAFTNIFKGFDGVLTVGNSNHKRTTFLKCIFCWT